MKNPGDRIGTPQLVLREWSPAGKWSSRPYAPRTSVEELTRPAVLLEGVPERIFLLHGRYPKAGRKFVRREDGREEVLPPVSGLNHVTGPKAASRSGIRGLCWPPTGKATFMRYSSIKNLPEPGKKFRFGGVTAAYTRCHPSLRPLPRDVLGPERPVPRWNPPGNRAASDVPASGPPFVPPPVRRLVRRKAGRNPMPGLAPQKPACYTKTSPHPRLRPATAATSSQARCRSSNSQRRRSKNEAATRHPARRGGSLPSPGPSENPATRHRVVSAIVVLPRPSIHGPHGTCSQPIPCRPQSPRAAPPAHSSQPACTRGKYTPCSPNRQSSCRQPYS